MVMTEAHLTAFGDRDAVTQARKLCIQPEKAASSVLGSPQHAEQSGKQALGHAQADMIRRADTFFIATYHEAEADDPVGVRSGNDVSHRGGPPGFVQLEGLDRLRWPDYIGNNFFQTLGKSTGNSLKWQRHTLNCLSNAAALSSSQLLFHI